MTQGIGTPNVAEHRGWRLPGQGAGHLGKTASSANRYTAALRTLSTQSAAPFDAVGVVSPTPHLTNSSPLGQALNSGTPATVPAPTASVDPSASPLGQQIDTTA